MTTRIQINTKPAISVYAYLNDSVVYELTLTQETYYIRQREKYFPESITKIEALPRLLARTVEAGKIILVLMYRGISEGEKMLSAAQYLTLEDEAEIRSIFKEAK